MATVSWGQTVKQIKKNLARKKRWHKRPEKPVRAQGVIYVQGELSPAALERLRKVGATIIRRDADATPRR